MDDTRLKVAVILPAYNEADTIGETLHHFAKELPTARFIVVDNNSSDRTAEIARDEMGRSGIDGTVLTELRQGKANAVRRAFQEVDADLYVLCDADTTYPTQAVHALMEPVLDGSADMTVGDRIGSGSYTRQNDRPLHGFGNRLVCWLVNRLFGAQLRDVMSGYRAFNRNFVKHYPIVVEGFQLETDMTLHALDKRFRIVEVPIAYRNRPVGTSSKLNTLTDGAKVIFLIAQLLRYYRPLLFFSAMATLFMLGGLLSAVPVFADWFRYHYIFHVPLAILAAAMEVVAAVMLAIGLILDSIAHQERMRFEREVLRS